MSFRPVDEQLRVIRRGLVDLVDERDLRERLAESAAKGRPLRVKLGIDPSSPDIHIGHTVVLRKLRDFQDLGHTAVLLWGTATAMVGDPTGRNKTRPQLTREMVVAHQATYKAQVGRVLDVSRIEERENGAWFDRMSFMDAVKLAARYTVAQLLERDTFQERYRRREPIAVHEFLYPLMQGWDSVQLEADVELGGTDQLFNLLVGRELQRHEGQRPQVCITVPILEGLDGVQKMSKSLGNHIAVLEPASEMFGKTMSIPDAAMAKWFTLLTDHGEAEIQALLTGHPRAAKVALAKAVVSAYHGAAAADAAEAEFQRVFRGGGLPDTVPEVRIGAELLRDGGILLANALGASGIAASASEGRRLIEGGGVRVDGAAVTDVKHLLRAGSWLVQAGKRKVARIVVP
ncbi:MAG: tyrosine--tRNA ligase [Planctomycetes bacterium]|nr:tyrosine--tRNA ligase [Planctomycetota bacterium]